MSIQEHAAAEMDRAGFDAGDKAAMQNILKQFFERWDSGGAVWAMAPVLMRLISGQPLSPLTGEDSEWHNPGGCGPDRQMLQNVRYSSVFKYADGRVIDIETDEPVTFPYDPVTRAPSDPVIEIRSDA
jgi:hypothetical protein